MNFKLFPIGRMVALRSYSQLGDLGGGAGKGGGGGGSIRQAGGSFGKMEVAREEEYFYKKQREDFERMKKMKLTLKEFLQHRINEHEKAIKLLKDMESQNSDMFRKPRE